MCFSIEKKPLHINRCVKNEFNYFVFLQHFIGRSEGAGGPVAANSVKFVCVFPDVNIVKWQNHLFVLDKKMFDSHKSL